MKSILLSLVFCTIVLISARSQANTKLSNLVAPTAINADLLPGVTNARYLGNSTFSWKDLHLRGYVYLDATRFVSNHPGPNALNAFLGSYSGNSITSGTYNTAVGHTALYKDTSGSNNTAIGAKALYSTSRGGNNTAIGSNSSFKNLTGNFNVAIGDFNLYNNVSGSYNTAVGSTSLYSNTGSYNTALGYAALVSNTTGTNNTASGYFSLYVNTISSNNSAYGANALLNNTGQDNTAMGSSAGRTITGGNYNTAIGSQALYSNSAGWDNTAVGFRALQRTVGDFNTAVGFEAGLYASTRGTFLGKGAYSYPDGLDNVTAIGFSAVVNSSNAVRIGNFNVTSIGGYAGWSNFSDGRYKKNVQSNVPGLEFIALLNPVTYTLDVDGLESKYKAGQTTGDMEKEISPQEVAARAAQTKMVHTGFIAQEVEQAARKLNYEFSGVDAPKNDHDFYGLRYGDFVVPLVKAVQELDAENKKLKEEVNELKEKYNQLAALITGNNGGPSFDSNAYLEQNAPNPFYRSTNIRYYVPEGSHDAYITITNMLGQLVKSVTLNSRGAGQMNIKSSALPAGSYIYSLWVDGKQSDSKKMVLTK